MHMAKSPRSTRDESFDEKKIRDRATAMKRPTTRLKLSVRSKSVYTRVTWFREVDTGIESAVSHATGSTGSTTGSTAPSPLSDGCGFKIQRRDARGGATRLLDVRKGLGRRKAVTTASN